MKEAARENCRVRDLETRAQEMKLEFEAREREKDQLIIAERAQEMELRQNTCLMM